MASTLEEARHSSHEMQNLTSYKAFQTLAPSSETSEHHRLMQNSLSRQNPIMVQISQSDQTNNQPQFTSPPLINTNMQSGYGSPQMALNLTATKNKLRAAHSPGEAPYLTAVQLLPGASKEDLRPMLPPPVNAVRVDQSHPQQIAEGLSPHPSLHYAYPLTHSSRPSLQNYEPKFFQDIAGRACMPLQTANQDILNKVNYTQRQRNERNVLDKYNRVKNSSKKKQVAAAVSNDVMVIQMPYYERVALARQEEERRQAEELAH